MPRNVGNTDRLVRIVIAVVAVVLAIVVGPSSVGGIILFVVAGMLTATAAIGWCPPYQLFGVTTCKMTKRSTN